MLVLDTGAIVALGPFQMLLGSTIMITTIPAHETLPGLMGNLMGSRKPQNRRKS